MPGSQSVPLPPPRPADLKKDGKPVCNTCCNGEKKKETVRLQVPNGTNWEGMDKALTQYSEGQLKNDPCLDQVDGDVREEGGNRFVGGGMTRESMGMRDQFGRDVWSSGVWTEDPVPSYTVQESTTSTIGGTSGTLTPKSIELLKAKGM